MPADKPIHRIAIVGTGVIGASWAALFLAHELEVIATDPAPNAESNCASISKLPGQPLSSWGCLSAPQGSQRCAAG